MRHQQLWTIISRYLQHVKRVCKKIWPMIKQPTTAPSYVTGSEKSQWRLFTTPWWPAVEYQKGAQWSPSSLRSLWHLLQNWTTRWSVGKGLIDRMRDDSRNTEFYEEEEENGWEIGSECVVSDDSGTAFNQQKEEKTEVTEDDDNPTNSFPNSCFNNFSYSSTNCKQDAKSAKQKRINFDINDKER